MFSAANLMDFHISYRNIMFTTDIPIERVWDITTCPVFEVKCLPHVEVHVIIYSVFRRYATSVLG